RAYLSLPPFPTRRSSDLISQGIRQQQSVFLWPVRPIPPQLSNRFFYARKTRPPAWPAGGYRSGDGDVLGQVDVLDGVEQRHALLDRKSTRLNSSHVKTSY